MIRFDDIVEKIQAYAPDFNLDILRKAYVFAAKAHKGQIRRSGEAYLSHPLEVLNVLVDWKLDEVTLTAGILHDILEDTDTTVDELKEYFGEEISSIVDSLSKISSISLSDSELQGENIRRIFMAMMKDIRVIFVKLADRLHNMRTLNFLSEDLQKKIASETLEIYAPLADRLGMGKTREELEDLAFRYLEPETYFKLAAKVEDKRSWAEEKLKNMKEEIQKLLDYQGIKAEIQYRLKRIYSIWRKMQRNDIDFDRVFDLMALRIITESTEDCYAVLGWISQKWTPIASRYRDYIAVPKQNKYQSLHTTVITKGGLTFEIQIRTKEMHWIAENGYAAHRKYKDRITDVQDDLKKSFSEFLEFQMDTRDPKRFLESLRRDLKANMVYPLTPKGKVIPLPESSTVVDFAYQIHTEIGNKCKGAKVNGRDVSLRYQVKTWDIVEIETSQDASPSRDWLGFIKTPRARKKIKEWFIQHERESSIIMGKRLFEKEIKKLKKPIRQYLQGENLENAVGKLGYSKIEDFYSAIGFGKIVLNRNFFERALPSDVFEPKVETFAQKFLDKIIKKPDYGVVVDGFDNILIHPAKCCNPIKGEKIVGYITKGKGISVHSASCPNIINEILEKNRLIDAKWDGNIKISYDVKIAIISEDRPGILAKITSVVSGEKSNIKKAEAVAFPDKTAKINFIVEVKDITQLEKLIKNIMNVKGVISVKRE
ncbi:MAG: bifunctional (p)ppGpp synthetase/guanosine-3',5'-bis(diphosphate) 3'-pyrophosphohydrolase [Acidobacteriota bacterium]